MAPVLHFHRKEGEYCCYPTDAEETYAKFASDWNRFSKNCTPKKLDSYTPSYYEIWKEDDLIQIRYWFWYHYNRFPRAPLGRGEHLGDWEHVEVRLYKVRDGNYVPLWLLSNHLGFRLASIEEKHTLTGFEVETALLTDHHINVWVALGSHASYPGPKSKPHCGGRIFCDKISEEGETWETWHVLKDIRETNFVGFEGRWGDERAPRSPFNEYNNRWRNAPRLAPMSL
jgi:hypothetical protein